MNHLLPFRVEYAKSGRSLCRDCRCLISKDELRFGKLVPSPYHDGRIYQWYHFHCSFSYNKLESLSLIANFDNLRWKDQEFVRKKIYGKRRSEPTYNKWQPKSKEVQMVYKRPKSSDLKKYKIEYVQSDDVECIGCDEPIGIGELQLSYQDNETGKFDEWHHLECFSDLREDFDFFESGSLLPGFIHLKKEDQDLVIKKLPIVQDENIPPAYKKARQEAVNEFVNDNEQLMRQQNEQLFNMRDQLKALNRNELIELLKYNDQRYSKCQDDNLDAAADRMAFGAVSKCDKCFSGRLKFISGYGYKCMGNLTTWTKCDNSINDPIRKEFTIPQPLREKYDFLKYYISRVEKRLLRISAPSSSMITQLMNLEYFNHTRISEENNFDLDTFEHTDSLFCKGNVVDLKTELSGIADIYQGGSIKYSVTLGITDVQSGLNSFYKLQILKYHDQEIYCLFRSWGRIGTTNGGSKLESLPFEKCISKFERLFLDKSGNLWQNKDDFVKQPYKMYPIDTEDDVDYNELAKVNPNIESTLQKPVQELMQLIFNINIMKNVMRDFKIDVDKMPLGKISKNQLEQAYLVLQELQQLIAGGFQDKMALIDASNRFYTLVPHSFGMSAPSILDSETAIREKCEMLEALIEMEIAYNLLNSGNSKQKHHLDAHYEQLNTQIDVLDCESEEFKLIERYAKNTHALTHSEYSLEIEDVFKVKRQGEAERYERFENLQNKRLLWHGSRTTNFASILSQGLRIAPPEAPTSGYMFGKGIYFADMVSKSANYCFANRRNPTGLLLLCDVALGNMYECHQAKPNIRLPKGRHSTFGRGQTYPDPNEICSMPNGVVVPCGTPTYDLDTSGLELLYNEYIVYDATQVKAQYLVRMKFKYK